MYFFNKLTTIILNNLSKFTTIFNPFLTFHLNTLKFLMDNLNTFDKYKKKLATNLISQK